MIFADSIELVETVPTGTFLDKIVPGLPKGRIVEIWGDESVGKSTFCMQLVANAQKEGLKCLWADVEYSYEAKYARDLGVDNGKLALVRNPEAEEVLDQLTDAIESGKYDIFVLDSIGGLTARAEIEKSSGEKTIGAQAGLVARFCRKVVPSLAVNGGILIVINHSVVEIMSGRLHTSGGKKLSYHKSLSVRLQVKPNASMKVGDKKVGKVVTATLSKDKVFGKEGAETEGQLIFGTGFSASADKFEELLTAGEITKEGISYHYRGEKLATGKFKSMERLKEILALDETDKTTD